jgi:hypothetical protein
MIKTMIINGTRYRVSYKHLNFSWRGKDNDFCLHCDEDIKYYDCLDELQMCAFMLKQIKQYLCLQNPYIFSKQVYNNIQAITICELSIDRVVKGVGFAFCGPQDQFCKKTGRDIALERASRDLQREENKTSIIYKEVQ